MIQPEEAYSVVENAINEQEAHLTKVEARALIEFLLAKFDIHSREKDLEQLLESQESRMADFVENIVNTTTANLMYENGLKTATLSVPSVVRGFHTVDIDVSSTGVITYTLQGDPINHENATH